MPRKLGSSFEKQKYRISQVVNDLDGNPMELFYTTLKVPPLPPWINYDKTLRWHIPRWIPPQDPRRYKGRKI